MSTFCFSNSITCFDVKITASIITKATWYWYRVYRLHQRCGYLLLLPNLPSSSESEPTHFIRLESTWHEAKITPWVSAGSTWPWNRDYGLHERWSYLILTRSYTLNERIDYLALNSFLQASSARELPGIFPRVTHYFSGWCTCLMPKILSSWAWKLPGMIPKLLSSSATRLPSPHPRDYALDEHQDYLH